MQLLYLVFGTNIQNHFQAHFSILTFLRQGQGELRFTTVLASGANYLLP
ncbi:hypothetical protein [Hymenobacter bucti]|uniref:Gamma-glutamylcyclotransferase n=1 Tax=Hymenobacter bucti TaxID=1844114 RepID=A0ABW4QQA1_9BACT